MLDLKPRVKRINKNLRIRAEAIELLRELAEAFETSEGRAIEALLETYAPAAIRQKQQEKK